MSRARISNGGGWTDGEKLKVMFSLLEANGKIDYNKAYIPPGRTLKAVHHMIQKEKQRAKSFEQGENEDGSEPNGDPASPEATPKSAKKPRTPKAAKGKKEAEPATTGGKRKRVLKEEDDGEDASIDEEDDPVKKIKQEMQDALDTAESFRMENTFGDSYGTEA